MTTRTAAATVPALRMPDSTRHSRVRAANRPAPPLSSLTDGRAATPVRAVYGFLKVDQWGRVAHADVERALGWVPGTRLKFQETDRVVIVAVDEHGVFRVPKQGHVYLPLPVRRWCGLDPGHQVLLVASPTGRLVIYSAAILDDLLAGRLADLPGGER